MKSDSLVACTCGDLYGSAESLPMGFTLPHKVGLWSSKAIMLSKTRTFYYSHHMNHSTLYDSDWFIRVSGCNLTWILKLLHTLLYHQKGFLHEIPTPSPHVILEHYHPMLIIWNTVLNHHIIHAQHHTSYSWEVT